MERNIYKIGKELFITNDEEIKRGDWYFYGGNIRKHVAPKEYGTEGFKKIILSTDQDLIKDGVQSIDDEFLEWFVKNPSCEEVKVKHKDVVQYGNMTMYDHNGDGSYYFCKDCEVETSRSKEELLKFGVEYYKIIIPKEESLSYEDFRKKASKELLEKFDNEASKGSGDGDFDNYFYGNCSYWENKLKEELTRKTDTCYNFNKEIGCVQTDCRCEKEEPKQGTMSEAIKEVIKNQLNQIEEPKQETLEEAAEKYDENDPNDEYGKSYRAFIEGAKWQQEQEKITTDDAYNEGFENGKHWQQEKSYSEEDLREAFKSGGKMSWTDINQETQEPYYYDFNEWFEQYKKK